MLQKINIILNNLNLKPRVSLKDLLKRKKSIYSFLTYHPESNKKYILKICVDKKKEAFFKKEIDITRFLSKKQSQNRYLKTVNFYKGGYSPFYWFSYTYQPGMELDGWFCFKKINKKMLIEILKALKELNNLTNYLPLSLKKNLFRFTFKNCLKEIDAFSKIKINYFKSLDFNQLKKYIYQNKKEFRKKKLVLSHGDLHPGNLILSPSNKIFILDWSNAQLNFSFYDLSYLWLALWLNPQLQSYIYSKIKKQDFSFSLFSISLIIRSLNLLIHLYYYRQNEKLAEYGLSPAEQQKRVKSYQKYLINLLKNILKENYESCSRCSIFN